MPTDTYCDTRIKLSLEKYNENKHINITKYNNVKILKDHSIPYINHNYSRIKQIK